MSLDQATAAFFSGLNGKWVLADRIFGSILNQNLFKMAPFVIVLGALWLTHPKDEAARRGVIAGACGGILAMFLTHLLQHLAPGRLRPWQTGLYPFEKSLESAGQVDQSGFGPLEASSFPSDTLGLACALALGIFAVSRRWGIFAFVWAIAAVVVHKLFAGLHYLSDIAVGVIIGLASTALFLWAKPITGRIDALAVRLQERHPTPFFILLLLGVFQFANLFNDLRATGNELLDRQVFKQVGQQGVAPGK